MCSNYRPVTRMDRLLTFFGVERGHDTPPVDVYPTGLAPFIRLSREGHEGSQAQMVVDDGHFGLLPGFAAELTYGRRTYNARTETVARLPSFRHAWAAGQRCVIPAESFYEPCWETGRAVRWRISQPGDVPMGIAGIFTEWKAPDGHRAFSFAMLTVNADGHPVMQRFHRPGDEKRMVVILDPTDYGAWLSCTVAQAPQFFRPWTGPLDAEPDVVLRAPRASGGKVVKPPPRSEDGELF